MSKFHPVDIYRLTGDVYTRTDNHPAFEAGEELALDNQLLEFFRNTSHLQDITEAGAAWMQAWPMRYHLSVQRANLLRPFAALFHNKFILEIGAECGALTRFLGEAGGHVVALEKNFTRASIIAERCRDLPHITVVNDAFATFACVDAFDIIIANGSPQFLSKSFDLLKEDGILMMAMDNKMGLKYWAGIPENHSGKAYAGIESRQVTQYGKEELQRLLEEAGFACNEYYFPFPDHKFPAVVLKEKALQVPGFKVGDLLLSNLDYVQDNWYAPSFSLERAVKQVIDNGLAGHLANSFLVLAQKNVKQLTDDRLLAWSYSAQRKKAYRKENIFRLTEDGRVMVDKRNMYPQAKAEPHALVYQHIHNETYIQGQIYFLDFLEIITTPGWSVHDLVHWAFPYYKLLLSLSQREGNEYFINGKFVDCTPFNIVKDSEGQLHLFDQEWQVNELIPLSYVLFRGLFYCLAKPMVYYPPQAGTPAFAFELVKKIMSAFMTVPDDMSNAFVARDHALFGPVSLFNRPPHNFRLHVLQEQPGRPVIKTGIVMAPLNTIHCHVARGEEAIIELKPDKQTYSLSVAETAGEVRVQLADETGMIGLYHITLKDANGITIQKDITYHDIIVADDICLLLSNKSAILFEGPVATIELELSLVDNARSKALATNMNKLLPLLRYGNNTPGVQQLITSLVKHSTEPLERQVAVLEAQVADDEKEISTLRDTVSRLSTVQEENARLRQTIDWYVRTYEQRSLAGVLKTRLCNVFRRIYQGLLNRAMATPFIKKKYAATYVLQYARDKGPYRFCEASFKAVRQHGLGNIRQAVLGKIRNNTAVVQPVPLEPVPDIRQLKQEMAGWDRIPKISIIVPVYNTPPALLQAAIRSVQNQVYENWELCIADDASTNMDTRKALAGFAGDPRIHIQMLPGNGGISAASNKALEAATGDYIALMDHDDVLTPDALFWIAKEINTCNNADIIYTDECKIDEQGMLSDHFRKPDWSPELLLNMMYPGHLTVYRKSFLVNKVGGFRSEYDFSQDYDLMLRAVEQTTHIRHIPRILYHWRMTQGSAAQGEKPYARQSNLAALADAMQRRGIDADIIELPTANRVQLKHIDAKVSIIIPTDSFNNLVASLDSINNNTSYSNYEVVVVTNSGLIQTMQHRVTFNRVKFVPYDLPYNFSDKCNVGVEHATGEVVIFFNDDVRPLQPDWIQNTIEYLWLPGVGGVSPKLVYENDTIQYAGMATGLRNLTGTTFHCYRENDTRYFNFVQSVRNVSILSGACLAMRKTVFQEIGGFDHINTPSSHSDVDLSFKLLDHGYRCVYTPHAVLRHIGHLSLQEHDKKEFRKDKSDIFLLRRWAKYLGNDPYFTVPMRNLLYHDSPEPYTLFPPATPRRYGYRGDVLLVCHDLTMSGAPIMLYDTCKTLLENGYFTVICCTKDGPLRKRYQQLGVTVIIDELILREHPLFYKFARNFDAIICNTVINWPVVKQMQSTVKTIWWLQEGQVLLPYLQNPDFVKTLRQAKHLVGVSDYSISFFRDYNPHYTKIYNACEDFHGSLQTHQPRASKDTLIFTIIGSIEHRKGQDVLLQALNYLDEEVMQKIEVHIVGRTLDETFRNKLVEDNRHSNRVRFVGEISREDAVDYLYGSDVVVSASRDDPFPVVLVEALCMGKPCIVSDRTGIAELITEGKNGFVFGNEDAKALANKIAFIARNPGILPGIGAGARNIYENHLTLSQFEKKLLNYLNDITETVSKNRPKPDMVTTLSEG
jgi:Glycosyltransferase